MTNILLVAIPAVLSVAFFLAYSKISTSKKLMICLITGMSLAVYFIAPGAAIGGIIGGGLEGFIILGIVGTIAGITLGGVCGIIVFSLAMMIEKIYSILSSEQ